MGKKSPLKVVQVVERTLNPIEESGVVTNIMIEADEEDDYKPEPVIDVYEGLDMFLINSEEEDLTEYQVEQKRAQMAELELRK